MAENSSPRVVFFPAMWRTVGTAWLLKSKAMEGMASLGQRLLGRGA